MAAGIGDWLDGFFTGNVGPQGPPGAPTALPILCPPTTTGTDNAVYVVAAGGVSGPTTNVVKIGFTAPSTWAASDTNYVTFTAFLVTLTTGAQSLITSVATQGGVTARKEFTVYAPGTPLVLQPNTAIYVNVSGSGTSPLTEVSFFRSVLG